MRSRTFTGREDDRDRCTKGTPLSFSRACAPSEPSAKWSSADKMASSLSSVSALSANSILTPSSTADSLFSSSGSLSGSTTCTWHVTLRKRRSDSPSPSLSLSLSLSLCLFLFHTSLCLPFSHIHQFMHTLMPVRRSDGRQSSEDRLTRYSRPDLVVRQQLLPRAEQASGRVTRIPSMVFCRLMG